MAEHTPGPWHWRAGRTDDGQPLISIETQPHAGDVAGIHAADHPCDLANARLIAAAPDLLAACKKAVDEVREYGLRVMILDALAKAEGSTNG